jgi:hypothetical protein
VVSHPRLRLLPPAAPLCAHRSHGIFYGAYGGSLSSVLTTTEYYYGAQVGVFGGSDALVVAGCTGSGVPCTGSLYYSSVAMPTSTSGTFNVAVSDISIPNGASPRGGCAGRPAMWRLRRRRASESATKTARSPRC